MSDQDTIKNAERIVATCNPDVLPHLFATADLVLRQNAELSTLREKARLYDEAAGQEAVAWLYVHKDYPNMPRAETSKIGTFNPAWSEKPLYTKPVPQALAVRDDLRAKLFAGWPGCSNHGCVVTGPKSGMGTNAICQCTAMATHTQLAVLQRNIEMLLSAVPK